jgi:hypothetical protein
MTTEDVEGRQQSCPGCNRELRYYMRGACYSLATLVEIRGVYDGGLFFTDPGCGFAWHRWPKGHHLRQRAEKYVQEWNERKGDPEWDLFEDTPV